MKTIIAGSRTIAGKEGYRAVKAAIGASKLAITEVVCGEAPGVDAIGKVWAHKRSIPVKSFPADWEEHGKIAGFKRNAEMAEYAHALIAVWDGESRGTYDMINKARTHELDITIVFVLDGLSINDHIEVGRVMVVPLAD